MYEINQDGYQTQCFEDKFRSAVGNSFATFGDSFKIDPSSLPIKPSTFGVEVIANVQPSPNGTTYQMSLIRGFKNFGFGISTTAGNSFYTNRSSSAAATTSTTSSTTSSTKGVTLNLGTLNIGGATAKPFSKDENSVFSTVAGLAAVPDPTSKRIGYRGGVQMTGKFENLGVSYEYDPVTQLPNWNLSAGLTAERVDFEITYRAINTLNVFADTMIRQTMANLVLQWGPLQGNLGYRYDTELGALQDRRWMGSLNFKVFSRARLAYMYNYIRSCHSLGMQILLL